MAVHKLKQEKNQLFERVTLSAEVVSIADREFVLDVDGSSVIAKKAAGCLVLPRAGDKVLCFLDEHDSYILSVLESAADENTHIKIDGALTLETQDDAAIVANNFNLVSRSSTSLYSSKLNISAQSGNCSIEDIKLNASSSVANIDNSQLISKSVETVADTCTQRYKNSLKFVECLDQLKAGNLMHTVKNLFSSRSRQAVVLADQDVKIDGERIHMG